MATGSGAKRRDTDLMALMMKDFKVKTVNDSNNNFYVEFKGPPDSLYQGGEWTVYVELPSDYPYQPPAIYFMNKIYHPNIGGNRMGKICVNILDPVEWSPATDLVKIFEMYLPQLLLEPNAKDPLNGEAGALMSRDKEAYEEKVKGDCRQYAQPGSFEKNCIRYTRPISFSSEEDEDEEDSEDTSDTASASGDEGMAGPADP